MALSPPLILTLTLDERAFTFFEEKRRRHFPPERNVIPAHLTLFHRLPGEHLRKIHDDLAACAKERPPIVLRVTGLRLLGRGVAYALGSQELTDLRASLASRWNEWLGPQDRQKHQPHVTVQNKVEPQEAKALLAELEAAFEPFEVTGLGLDLWRYRGGPWDEVRSFPFARDSSRKPQP